MSLPRKRDWALAVFLVVFPLCIMTGDWYYVVDDPIRPWIKDRASWGERILVSTVEGALASGLSTLVAMFIASCSARLNRTRPTIDAHRAA